MYYQTSLFTSNRRTIQKWNYFHAEIYNHLCNFHHTFQRIDFKTKCMYAKHDRTSVQFLNFLHFRGGKCLAFSSNFLEKRKIKCAASVSDRNMPISQNLNLHLRSEARKMDYDRNSGIYFIKVKLISSNTLRWKYLEPHYDIRC